MSLLVLFIFLSAFLAAAKRSFWTRDLLALVLLTTLALGFFWRLWLGDAYAPAGGGDLASFLYPYYAFGATSLHQGTLPLWNPYAFSGMPFVGDIQNGLFYPLNLAQFLLSPEVSYLDMQALVVLHVVIAGACMYLCLRLLPEPALSSGPALLGAVAFMLSDLFIMHFGNLNMVAVAAWLPLTFLCFAHAQARGSLFHACLGGLVLGLSALAGHIQITLLNWLFLALFALWRGVSSWADERLARPASEPLLLLGLTTLVAAAASAPATLPALVISSHTVRADFSYWEASRYSLSAFRILGLLLPDLTGRDPALHWGLDDRVESGYLGLLPLLLAFFAVFHLRRNHWVRFLSLAGLAFLLLALGDGSPLHGWVYALVPGMALLRAPARALYLVDFSLATLAAFSCQALLSDEGLAMRRALHRFAATAWRYAGCLLGLLLAASFLALLTLQDRDPVILSRAWMAAGSVSRGALVLAASIGLLRALPSAEDRRRQAWAWLAAAVALCYVDLASVGAYVDLGREDPASGFRHPAAIAFLQSDPEPFRVDVDPAAAAAWQPNLGLLHNLEHTRGVPNPMELSRYRRFLELASDRGSRLYDLLGAKYLVVPKAVNPGPEKFAPVFNDDPLVDVHLNRNALPLALVVHAARTATDPAEAERLVAQPGFDPTGAVVIEGYPPPVEPAVHAEKLGFLQRSPNRVDLHADLSSPGFLLLTVPYCPGWEAELDGRRVTIWPAHLAFMAVWVPQGVHQVSFAYRPPLLTLGLALCLIALAATAALTVLHLKTRGPARGEASCSRGSRGARHRDPALAAPASQAAPSFLASTGPLWYTALRRPRARGTFAKRGGSLSHVVTPWGSAQSGRSDGVQARLLRDDRAGGRHIWPPRRRGGPPGGTAQRAGAADRCRHHHPPHHRSSRQRS